MKPDIARKIDITNTFEQTVISENGKKSMFSKVVENRMADYIQSIQIAPDGVVTEIYPEAGNEAGKIDLIHDKERGKISCYARDNDVITMQGPFSLKQGRTGIAVRNPVYLEQAKTASVEKYNFLFNMSHNIRTSMNAVIGMTSLIRHDAGNKEKVIRYADKIDISSQHLLGIME